MENKNPIQPLKSSRIDRELRHRAENLMVQQGVRPVERDPSDYRSMVQELQIHQVELELQNQELQQAHLEAELARRKYFELYDLAPVGYATFNERGEILEINLTGAQLLGRERRFLISQRFQPFIAPKDIPVFNRFTQEVFRSDSRQSCELVLNKKDGRRTVVRIEGVRLKSERGPGRSARRPCWILPNAGIPKRPCSTAERI